MLSDAVKYSYSLITALAAASGHKLVRINLSEQTDIADLMGSDLPVQNSGTGGASFEWCDGILLTAIKEGSWVLLDELNLASQSVLEGLNSCLDHRATVFIPELGQTFHCPETFRVFGAQNPLGQGGGRKGLPKSFLNRFTKVFVDPLTDSDLRAIVGSRFPSFEKNLVDRLIDFNNTIHRDVVDKREYGAEGSPWEFNLRDVFRSCELISASLSSSESFARDLYFQRFRTQDDRNRVDETFKKYFNCSLKPLRPPEFRVTDSSICIGGTTLHRFQSVGDKRDNPLHSEPEFFLSQLLPMEAVARCVSLRWPCLLVGATGSGKTSIVASLAELSNVTLVEQCLSPSSDVTELLGCFEQVETMSEIRKNIKGLCDLANEYLLHHSLQTASCQRVWGLLSFLFQCLQTLDESGFLFFNADGAPCSKASDLCRILLRESSEKFCTQNEEKINVIASVIDMWGQAGGTRKCDDAGHFIWRDGVLVEAMLKGYWLLLENVNLCPSSVLDRLNSVMEKDGELLLSECGTQDGEDSSSSSHRLIKPHPNFRVFLTMNPANGEISRAMRNRCVEISLLQPIKTDVSQGKDIERPGVAATMTKGEKIDFLGGLRHAGARSLQLASALLHTHTDQHAKSIIAGEEPPCLRSVSGSVSMLTGLLMRGLSGDTAMRSCLQLSYEIEEEAALQLLTNAKFNILKSKTPTPLPQISPIRSSWLVSASTAHVEWEARLLRSFVGNKSNIVDELTDSQLGLLSLTGSNPRLVEAYQQILALQMKPQLDGRFQDIMIQLFLSKVDALDMETRFSYLNGLESTCSSALSWMASVIRKEFLNPRVTHDPMQYSGENPSAHAVIVPTRNPYISSKIHVVQLGRLNQKLREHKWHQRVSTQHAALESLSEFSVLETSFYIHETLLDRTKIPCPVTPIVYPLLNSLDRWISCLLHDSCHLVETEEATFVGILSPFLEERDRLWCHLEECPMTLQPDSFLGFEEAEFIVQWKWLKKRYACLSSAFSISFSDESFALKQRVDALATAIDEVLFGSAIEAWSSHSIRKHMIRPIVPKHEKQWEALFELRTLAEASTIISDRRFCPLESSKNPVDLKELVDIHHPILFLPKDDKAQLLAALCTLHWSWTDEVEGVKRSDNSIFVNTLFHGRIKESFEQKRQDFIAEVELAKVDLDIATVENQFSVEALERLKDSSALTISSSDTYSRVAKSLLQSFGRIQLSFLAEFWCTCEENRLTGEICRSLLEYEEDKQLSQKLSHLLSDVKRFVNVVLASTIWSINDIQPYQTLIWAVEGWSEKHGSLKTLLRRLLSTMLFAASKHLWSNSFIDESAVSMHLELPSAWGDDEAINHRPICTGDLSPCFGSVRLRQQVRSEFMLRLLGKQLVLVKGGEVNFKFHTMENHLCRLFQYREMVQMLSSFQFPVSKASLHIVQYLFVDILEALRVRFRDEAIVHLILLAKQPESLLRTSGNDILRLGNNCKNDFCRRYCSDLIAPLFGCIQRASNMKEDSLEYAKETALAFVHLGLLRLTILVPDTPLDPGRAPLAKITLINRKLGTVSTNITALRLDSGFIYGDFMPESSDMIDFLTEGESLIKKRSSQQKKVVERLKTSPPFHELFRETRDFVQRVSANGAVVQLVQMLCGTSSTELEDGRGRALNWQKTAAAFCQRLTDDYAAYEDLTAALVDAVKMIQNGLHVLTEPESTRCDTFISQLFGLLVQFPMRGHSEIVQSTMELLTMLSRETITLNKRGKSDLHFGLSLAVLARLVLKKRLVGLSNDEWVSSCAIFDALTKSHLVQSDESIKGESIEDVQEREFREQFPDYRREFHGLLEESMPEDLYDTEIPREEEKSATVEDTFVLSDQQIGLLCSIYQDLFSEDTTGVSDSARALAFHSGYSAAYQLEESFKCSKKPALGSEPVGGHVFAMALTSVPKMGSVRVHSHLHNGASMVDFQNEPCPAESMLAMGPLERLMARATQLLTAFPGHPILIGIGKVCDKVCKFDLMATPIGKVMTGLEVILRQAQDWEQHASDRVRLGVSLQEIGQLVARWRKRELESWSKLIRSRQDRHVRRAQKHWVRLHSVLHNDGVGSSQSFTVKEPSVNAFTDCQPCTPNWVWKGLVFMKQALSDSAEDLRLDDLRELVKVLDTFVLTSPLGEYEERLKLIKSSSLQLQTEYNASNKTSSWRLQQSRALLSVWFYYHQFLPVISSKLEALRKPIETKLKDEVKLAKWDEQSYYALAESTERNHRKLMKILSEFDESLGLNVGLLIQEETCRGIRSESDTRDEFCSSVPSDSLMFPISLDMKEDRRSGVVKEIFYGRVGNNTGNWVDASVIGTPSDSHLARIAKYARKMQLLTKGGGLLSESWATIGENEISSFCDSIFERIGSLREKSTRPMKERALVDLFREMKKNGFTVTKWSVPDELRRMEQIFQLPKPNIAFSRLRKTDVLTLDRAEKYYMRCLVEMNALRSETLMLGSKYMSKREMNLMVGLSESGMLMLAQQRSLVSNVIVDIAVLTDHASAMQLDSGDLPVLQSTLQPLVMNFEKNYSSTLETLRQLSLLLKSSQTLLLGNKKTDWARDAIAKLESFPLSSYVDAKHIKADIVTWGKLQCIEKDYTCLREIERVIRECREECRILGCFPVDIFDAPLSIISETLCIASECKKCVDDRGSVNGRGSNASDFSKSLSSTIEKTLITFQNFCQDASISNLTNEKKDPDEPGVDSIDISIWECHRGLAKAWAGLRLQDLNQTLVDLLQQLTSLQDTTPVSKDERKCYIGLLRDAGVLVKNIQSLSETLLGDSLSLYSTAAKLNYIILRVFRVLVSKGYCSDKSSEDDGGDADGDINGMTFEDDQDGTGMGEGDGKRDVTDQLENEEQLLGLKSDQDNETDKPENQESRQLNEDEAEQGMEMEGDFDGEMCDLPENSADDDMDEKDGEEELERELGEDSSPDEQVVDERMWNESDDEEEIKKDEEKFEKNSSVDGEAIEGETRTKDDDENEKPSEDKNEKQTEASEPKGGQENDGEVEGNDDEGINEDNDDRYEDQQGVDVRGEENEADDASNTGEDEMELGDDICLDGEDDGDADMDDNVVEEEDIDDSGSTGSSESKGNNQEALHEGDDEEEADNVDSSTVPTGEGTVNPLEDEQQGETDAPDEAMDEEIFDNTTQQPDTEEAHGIKSSQGTDAVKEEGDEEEGDEGADEGDEPTGGTSGTSQADNSQSDANGGAGYSERDGTVDESTDMKNEENTSDVPNPFKDPGDASKFWHKKLDVVESNPEADESTEGRDNDDSDSQDKKNGDFQFTSADQKSTSQVLGETTQEEAVELEAQEREEEVVEDTNDGQEAKKQDNEEQQEKRKNETSRQSKKLDSTKPKLDETSAEKNDVRDESVMDEEVKEEEDEMSEASEKSEEDRVENEAIGNKVVSDLSKIAVTDEDTKSLVSQMVQDEQVSGISTAEAAEARSRWLKIQGETHNLSRRLCEKLRLVMEPLVASKLRGDYRSGKRINMKRVIGYIASGYRKDKIWLRRTKPAKRDYRVLLAVDDSESMKKSGAGEMALRAMATLAIGMNQLEIGELGVASFGDDMKLLHPFHLPFTSETGADMVMSFGFNQPRTRTALCVESAIASLESFGGHSSMQLVFLISDGRIERDSRAALKRLIREMVERNILLAMIIVEGEHKKKDSIVNMKEVSFVKGKPVVKRFIEDYPFPYYIILDDMTALPEVMGDALRQWFEMLGQLKGSG